MGYLVLLPFFLLPLMQTRFLPGLDLPFHLSMADMLRKAGEPGSPYAGLYSSTLGLKPYELHYLLLLGLAHVMTLVQAHALITAAYVAGLPLAMSFLLHVFGRSRIPALLAFPLAYNLCFHYGFFSFTLSLLPLLLLLACLARLLAEARRPALWASLAAASALTLFATHLQNFAFGLAACGALILFGRATWSRRGLALVSLLPAVVGLVGWSLTSRYGGDPSDPRHSFSYAWHYAWAQRLADLPRIAQPWRADILQRLRELPGVTLTGFVDQRDGQGCLTIIVVIAGTIVMGGLGLLLPTRGARARFRLAGVVICLGALAAYVGMPHHLPAFELMTFYPRFGVLVVLFALLLVPAGLRRFPGPLRWVSATPIVLVSALYGLTLVDEYRAYGAEVSDFAAVLDNAVPGHAATGVVFDRRSHVIRVSSVLLGLPWFYVADKPRSLGSSMVVWYCGMRHMPCRFEAGAFKQAPFHIWIPASFDPAAMLPLYDYVFVRSLPPGFDLWKGQANRVRLVARSGTWQLWQAVREPTRDGARPGAR